MQATSLLRLVLCTIGTLYLHVAAKPTSPPPVTFHPRVDLGYATYEGSTTSDGVNQFLGLRYAAPATGTQRFRLPTEPHVEKGVVKAKRRGPVCYGVTNPASPDPPFEYSEDCLFIDIFSPANATASREGGLPVMLWLQGGGFTQNYNANYNGSGLIQAAQGNMLVATFNYRVGPYGFLANDELKAEGNLNVGLHDQLAAIRWVQQHISAFGGDPKQITLFGVSAGGGSVLLHTFAYGGDSSKTDTVQWSAGIAESMFLPSVYTVEEMEFHCTDLLAATNCSDLECLRQLPIEQLQSANVAMPFPSQQKSSLFGYGPVIDGALIPDRLSNLLKEGRFFKDKQLIMGSSNTEGTLFAPQANGTKDVDQFMNAQFPNLTDATLRKLNDMYSSTPATFPRVTTVEAPLYYRTAEIYGDSSFVCPLFNFATGFSKAGVHVHVYLDRIHDPVEVAAGYIVPHTWDLQAVWGPSYATNYVALTGADSYEPGKSNAAIIPIVQGYWTSFAASGNPNTLKSKEAPTWERFMNGNFLNVETNNTRMAKITEELSRKCNFWSTLGSELGQ